MKKELEEREKDRKDLEKTHIYLPTAGFQHRFHEQAGSDA